LSERGDGIIGEFAHKIVSTEVCSGQGFSDEHSLKPIAQEVNFSASPICFTTFIKGAAFSSSVSQKPPPGPLLELMTFLRAKVCNIFAKKEVGICNASAMSLGANLLVAEAYRVKYITALMAYLLELDNISAFFLL